MSTMEILSFQSKASDGQTICYRRWSDAKQAPKALCLIAHGMAEHGLRYAPFAEALVAQGFVVIAPDHRGHGLTAAKNQVRAQFGSVYPSWPLLVDDLATLLELERHQGEVVLPAILFGHSMGSYLARSFVVDHSEAIEGLILCGTAGLPSLREKVTGGLIKVITSLQGRSAVSPFLNKLFARTMLAAIKAPRTPFDWLSHDEAQVDAYLADPDCGFDCTNGFYQDMFWAWFDFHKRSPGASIPSALPLLLVAGQEDPVGNYGAGVKASAQWYREMGLTDVSCILYPEARHELLNERCSARVIEDILHWLGEHGR